jgi:hypothetical protein
MCSIGGVAYALLRAKQAISHTSTMQIVRQAISDKTSKFCTKVTLVD